MFWFSVQILSEIFLILRRIQRDIIKYVHRSSCKAHFILGPIVIKLDYSRFFFGKHSNNKFHENPSSWSLVVTCGQRDRQTERETCRSFSQFCNHTKKNLSLNFVFVRHSLSWEPRRTHKGKLGAESILFFNNVNPVVFNL